MRNLIVYQHRNPEKHGIEQDFKHYPWTSYQELSSPHVESHVDRDLTLSKFGGVKTFFAAHDAEIPLGMTDFEFGGGQG
ncbi:MAG: hypothetical protein AB8H12_01360 [Lewinella sp.]